MQLRFRMQIRLQHLWPMCCLRRLWLGKVAVAQPLVEVLLLLPLLRLEVGPLWWRQSPWARLPLPVAAEERLRSKVPRQCVLSASLRRGLRPREVLAWASLGMTQVPASAAQRSPHCHRDHIVQ